MSTEPMGILWQEASNLIDAIVQEIGVERCSETHNKKRVKRLYGLRRKAFKRWKRRDIALKEQNKKRIAA